jgi:glyoxylase-like metal-dependent hydrolase (beta-lactamase superfamily II)
MAPGVYLIDCHFGGVPRQGGVFLVEAERNALIDTGPSVSVEHVVGGLDLLGVESLDFIALTHFHLDHAGATALLLERYPEARVLVDGRSARYMVDPERLVKSAARALGELARHYGTMPPVPESGIMPLSDGYALDLGDRAIEAVYSPGHSNGHYAFLERATGNLFCGDALGHYIEDDAYVYPATPPPEFDPDTSTATARRLGALEPRLLLFPHFGSSRRPRDVIEQFIGQVARSLEAALGLDDPNRTPRALAELLFADIPGVGEEEAGLVMGMLEVNAAGVLHYLDRARDAR